MALDESVGNALVNREFVAMTGLEDLSVDDLRCNYLQFIKRTLVPIMPKQQTVPYFQIRKLRLNFLGIPACSSHLFPVWLLTAGMKHALDQPKVGIRILGLS